MLGSDKNLSNVIVVAIGYDRCGSSFLKINNPWRDSVWNKLSPFKVGISLEVLQWDKHSPLRIETVNGIPRKRILILLFSPSAIETYVKRVSNTTKKSSSVEQNLVIETKKAKNIEIFLNRSVLLPWTFGMEQIDLYSSSPSPRWLNFTICQLD